MIAITAAGVMLCVTCSSDDVLHSDRGLAVAEKVSGSRPLFYRNFRRTASVLGMNRTGFRLDIARVGGDRDAESIRTRRAYESQKTMDSSLLPAEAEMTGTVKRHCATMRLLTALLGNSRAGPCGGLG